MLYRNLAWRRNKQHHSYIDLIFLSVTHSASLTQWGNERHQDTEARAQSCGPRTMQCLDPVAAEQPPAGCADARRARALLHAESPGEEVSGAGNSVPILLTKLAQCQRAVGWSHVYIYVYIPLKY